MPVIVLVRVARSPQWHVVVLIAQVILIPELAFALYALTGGEPPDLGVVAIGAGLFYVGALALIVWSLYERRKLMQPVVSYEAVNRQHQAAFLARSAAVLFMSALTFAFEPWLAAANVLANAIWTLAWIPRQFRYVTVDAAETIARPPDEVFDFISDTENWPRYRDDIVNVEPRGRVAAGTEVVTRLATRQLSRPNPKLAKFIEVRSVITSVEPGKGYTTALVGHPEEVGAFQLEAVDGGTRVTSGTKGLLTWPQAALGLGFHAGRLLAVRKAELQAVAARLKQVLEDRATSQ